MFSPILVGIISFYFLSLLVFVWLCSHAPLLPPWHEE